MKATIFQYLFIYILYFSLCSQKGHDFRLPSQVLQSIKLLRCLKRKFLVLDLVHFISFQNKFHLWLFSHESIAEVRHYCWSGVLSTFQFVLKVINRVKVGVLCKASQFLLLRPVKRKHNNTAYKDIIDIITPIQIQYRYNLSGKVKKRAPVQEKHRGSCPPPGNTMSIDPGEGFSSQARSLPEFITLT